MKIPKQQIMDMLRDSNEPGDASRADEAERELPDQVDTEDSGHKSTMEKYGVKPQDLLTKFSGKFGL